MKFFIFLLIFLSASLISPSPSGQGTVIWNVGQGQWMTVVEGGTCFHFDMGGEFFPWQRMKALCGLRENKVLLSHWDWDHIGALADRKLRSALPDMCMLVPPMGPAKKRKMDLIKRFKSCAGLEASIFQWRPVTPKNSNEASQVFRYHDVLTAGDSTTEQEKIWSRLKWVSKARVLLLGHHGSKTSTSKELLQSLPSLQMAISSARWKRYSHPHPQTVARLRLAHVPLLRTEDWGNIWIE